MIHMKTFSSGATASDIAHEGTPLSHFVQANLAALFPITDELDGSLRPGDTLTGPVRATVEGHDAIVETSASGPCQLLIETSSNGETFTQRGMFRIPGGRVRTGVRFAVTGAAYRVSVKAPDGSDGAVSRVSAVSQQRPSA